MLKLFEVLYEVEKFRQNGKTTFLAQAADDAKGIFLVSTFDQAKSLQPLFPNATILTAHNLEQIRSHNKIIFIDHYLLFILAKNLVKEKDDKISELEDTLMERTFELHKTIAELEDKTLLLTRKAVDCQSRHNNDIARLEQAYERIEKLHNENEELKKSSQSFLSKIFKRNE